MSSSSPSLEEELQIPLEATLSSSSPNHPNETISAFLVLNQTHIPISASTSLRNNNNNNNNNDNNNNNNNSNENSYSNNPPRCLIVGRQAAFADVRVDHKSISRKHAVLYFISGVLYLMDLGGKKGTQVNQSRMQSGSQHKIALKDGDVIQFGTFPQLFHVQMKVSKQNKQTATSTESATTSVTSTAPTAPTPVENGSTTTTANISGPPLSGREQREAEIAAMMKSLEETPSYTPFRSTSPPPSSSSSSPSADDITKKTSTTTNNDNNNHMNISDNLPITHATNLSSTRTNLITSLAMDPSGSRILTGSLDASLSMYDFGGMDSSHSAFKTIDQLDDEGRHPILSISYSNTGDRFVVGTTSSQPSVFDRDGHFIIQFAGGDKYVTNMLHTPGHVSTVTSTCWHPFERDLILTSSTDGSVRIWDVMNGITTFQNHLKCQAVYPIKNKQGRRTQVSCATYHPNGRYFVAGTTCGSLQIYKSKSNLGKPTSHSSRNANSNTRPDQAVFDIHNASRINSVIYNKDGSLLATRGEDDSVMVWDATSLKQLFQFSNLVSWYESANCAFSPDGSILIVGTSVKAKSGEHGKLFFFDVSLNTDDNDHNDHNDGNNNDGKQKKKKNKKKTSISDTNKPIKEMNVAPANVSAVRVFWHMKLNQIFVGLSNGRYVFCTHLQQIFLYSLIFIHFIIYF